MIKFTSNLKNTKIDTEKRAEIIEKVKSSSMSGWVNLPEDYSKEELARVKAAAKRINEDSKYLVAIGIGGSYLGARAVIEALGNNSPTKVVYAGNSLSALEAWRVLDEIGDADFSINVISKSGTTTEPAVAFRIFKEKLIKKYGEKEAYKRIYATTDAAKGALHTEAVTNGYERFVVPDDIGGRYSVLTAVGLLPIAAAGIDVDELLSGANEERKELLTDGGAAFEYAGVRNELYSEGKTVEIFANFEPSFMYFNEWLKQLFGESEGKDGKGIFPASVIFTTDLHSMGQYIQEGRLDIFETIVEFGKVNGKDLTIPKTEDDLDGLEYLQGRDLAKINQEVVRAVEAAHKDGGIEVLNVVVPEISARTVGALLYFFEFACACSAFVLGVDPFNQPGVEAYKNNMFRILGKPGY
jgi:glucose-6-phosphate isomerase